LSENAAIMIYLNDKHSGNLLNDDKGEYERAKAMLWLMFANSGLHGAYSKVLFCMKNGGDEKIIKKACDNVQSQWDEIEAHLNREGTKFLAGDDVTAGDIYTAVVANWQFIPHLPTFGEKTQILINTVSGMPSFQTVLANESVDYKAAA
jgi:glutathione S-transferase